MGRDFTATTLVQMRCKIGDIARFWKPPMHIFWTRITLFATLFSSLTFALTIRSVDCYARQDTPIVSQIESQLANSIEKTRQFRKVSFNLATNSGRMNIEVSFEDDNYAVVINPLSNEGHYATNAYACNEDYGFWVSKEDTNQELSLRTVTEFVDKTDRQEHIYSYGQKLTNLAAAGMISLPDFCPLSYLRFSDPTLGVQSITQVPDSTDLYIVRFQSNLSDVTDRFANVYRLSSLKSGHLTLSKNRGFLPVSGELHRTIKHNDGTIQRLVEKVEWKYEEFEDAFRLTSYVQYREDLPVESRLEMSNFQWQSTLLPDEFRMTRFGFDEPKLVKSNSSMPNWLWIVVAGLFLVIVSWCVYRKWN
ncbi:MAG: hypothetical protein Q8M16_15545 [Pirellulaceae bacterium]|nr:hypothetical protein [Pirellulaceae bacterium]